MSASHLFRPVPVRPRVTSAPGREPLARRAPDRTRGRAVPDTDFREDPHCPLPTTTGVHSDRPDRLRDAVRAHTSEHEVLGGPRPLDGFVTGCRLGEVDLVYARYGAPVRVDIAPQRARCSVTVPLGPMRVRAQGPTPVRHAFLIDPEAGAVVEPDPGAGALVISVTGRRLGDHLDVLTGKPGPLPRFLPPSTAPGARPGALLDAVWPSVCRVLRGAVRQSVPGSVEVALEEMLLSAVLFGLPHSRSRELLAPPQHGPVDGDAARARDWLDRHYAHPLTTGDIAAACGVSVRQLQYVFLRQFGVPPTEYLRRLRLDRARELLTRASESGSSPTVSAVAHRCGFTHLGRFAQSYRRRFGEPPSATLGRSAP